MGSVSAKGLREALAKAQKLGLVEEEFVLADCALVVRNLRPDEYEAILNECNDLT